MIEAGKTYLLRGGLTARITVTDIKGRDEPIGGYVDHGDREMYRTWYPNGHTYDFGESGFDIILPEPERGARWMNWYNGAGWSGSYGTADHFVTRELADKISHPSRTHVFEIITENGEPVDVKIHKVER